MTLNYKQIGGGAVGIIILGILLLIGGKIEITDNTYICTTSNQTCEANYGISSGAHTRCYITQEQKDNWRIAPYCSNGWIRIKDYVIQEEIPDYINNTLLKWHCNNEKCCNEKGVCK